MRAVRCGNPPHFVSSLWRWYLTDAAIRVDTRSRKKKERKEKTGWRGGMGVGGGGGWRRGREKMSRLVSRAEA